MKQFFNRAFPYGPPRNQWYTAILIGLFVFIFLFVFKPFNLDGLRQSSLLRSTAIYGLISFVVTISVARIPAILFPSIFNEDNWTLSKEFILQISVFLLVATGNYLYTVWVGYISFSIDSFLTMFIWTFSLAVIVISGLLIIKTNLSLRKYLRKAQEMNQHILQQIERKTLSENVEDLVLLESEIKKQNLEIPAAKIIYLTSEGNYIHCFYLDENTELTSGKIRNRMKTIEQKLADFSDFFRCHRAFIINKNFIRSVNGNAKGYSLVLKDIEQNIPVARSKSQELQAILS